RTLEALANDNALVVGLGPGREWYHYHPLLRQMLYHQLAVDDPPLVSELHRRAAIWYADHGAPIDAIRRAVSAQDWDLLGQVLLNVALPRLLTPEAAALVAAMQPVAIEAAHDPNAVALICAAAADFHRHD